MMVLLWTAVVAHAFNANTQEAEAGGCLPAQGQSSLHRKTMPQKRTKQMNKRNESLTWKHLYLQSVRFGRFWVYIISGFTDPYSTTDQKDCTENFH